LRLFRGHAPVKIKGENGHHYYISKIEAIMTQLANQAAKNDNKAVRTFFEILKAFPAVIVGLPPPLPVFHINFVKPDGKGGIASNQSDEESNSDDDEESKSDEHEEENSPDE
jgi:hypothetical protein